MSVKKVFFVLLSVHSCMFAVWSVHKIENHSDMTFGEAYYGPKGSKQHDPLTKKLAENSDKKEVVVAALPSSVGKKSQGFNSFTLQDKEGNTLRAQFDYQRGNQLKRGRGRKTALHKRTGKDIANPRKKVARAELRDSDDNIISSDAKNYDGDGRFSIIVTQDKNIQLRPA